MKNRSFVCAVMNCLLVLAPCYAATSNPAPQAPPESSANTASANPEKRSAPSNLAKRATKKIPVPKRVTHRRTSATNHAFTSTSSATANLPKFPSSRDRFVANSQVANKFAISTKGPIQTKTVSSAPPVRRSSMLPTSASSLDAARHRGPNPAVIGGIGSFQAGNTGGINGSRIARKP